jgi:hypothetical protein
LQWLEGNGGRKGNRKEKRRTEKHNKEREYKVIEKN